MSFPLRIQNQEPSEFVSRETVAVCECCDTTVFIEQPEPNGQHIRDLGWLCSKHYLDYVESESLGVA